MFLLLFSAAASAAALSSLSSGDLIITELMVDPTAVLWYRGEWLEIYNASTSAVDLDGLEVTDGAGGGFTVSTSTTVAAGGYALLAVRSNSAVNGGLPSVDVTYSRDDLPLFASGGTVTLEHGGVVFDSVSWDAAYPLVAGRSLSLSADALGAADNDSADSWCAAHGTYGDGDFGSPGAANPDCVLGVDALQAGDLLVSEVLHTPDASENGKGDWLELYNNTEADVDLDGLLISDSGTDALLITGELIIAAGEYAVIAARDVSSRNGNLPRVDYRYIINSELNLERTDDLSLSYGSVVFDEVSWSDTLRGVSRSLDASSLDPSLNDIDGYWCEATSSYGDGDYGTPGSANGACAVDLDGDGASIYTDCDDADPDSYPGATERCDSVDNDCDGDVDEGTDSAGSWYADADGDGYGDPDTGYTGCAAPSGYITDNTDCDDTNADISPSGVEVCDDLDNDCDGTIDVGTSETPTWYADADDDKYGDPDVSVTACERPHKYRANGLDCDDDDEEINPGASEVCGNQIDEDCDDIAQQCTVGDQVAAAEITSASSTSLNFSSGALSNRYGSADFNGDGIVDLWADYVFDDRDERWSTTSTGYYENNRAVIFYGPITGDLDISDADASAGFTGESYASTTLSQGAMSGDLDGDGYDDLLLGQFDVETDEDGRFDYSEHDYQGAINVFYGPITGEVDLTEADTLLTYGDYPEADLAAFLAYDYDNDGADEVLAMNYNHFSLPMLYDDSSEPIAHFSGDYSSDALDADHTTRFHLAGDLNGDGDGDIMGADYSYTSFYGASSGAEVPGSTFILYGPLSGSYAAETDYDVEIESTSTSAIGEHAEPLGDTNGDGYDDVLLFGDVQTFLVHGPISADADIDDAVAMTVETDSSDLVAVQVKSAGDIDGDGILDAYTVSSHHYGEGDLDWTYGYTHIVYGPLTGTQTISLDAVPLFGSYRDHAYSSYRGGDFDNDGLDDLLVHQSEYNDNDSLFIVFGSGL